MPFTISSYPYPLFEVLNTTERTVLFGGAALLMTFSTAALQWLYGKVNGLEEADNRTHKRIPSNIKSK
jgi:hypothetical protein